MSDPMGKLRPGKLPEPEPGQAMEMANHLGISVEEASQKIEEERANCRVWLNNLYQINERRYEHPTLETPMVHLSIKRRDKKARMDWRHLQQIKNELVGPECEGCELFPAESRLVDTANQYHLWVFGDAEMSFPFGFDDRAVIPHSGGGATQRPIEE